MSHHRRNHIKPHIKRLRRQKRLIQRPWFWVSFLIVVCLLGGAYFLLFFPKIQVVSFQIIGNEKISSRDIEAAALADVSKKIGIGQLSIPEKSIFFVNTKRVAQTIEKKFPGIEEVWVQKQLPHTISITVHERKPVAVFCESENKCQLVDSQGVLFEKTGERSDMILIRGGHRDTIPRIVIEAILNIETDLKDNFQIAVVEASLHDTLAFRTGEGWSVYFDPNADMTLEIKKMDTLLKNEISPAERKDLHYIYLQYKDKAYYK